MVNFYKLYSIPNFLFPIPGAMLSYEHTSGVFFGKALPSVKIDTKGGNMSFKLQTGGLELAAFSDSELWIFNLACMAIGVSKVQPRDMSVIKLIWRNVISKIVSSVISKPDISSFRVPIKAHCVTNAACKDLEFTTIRVHSGYRCVRVAFVADIARRSDRDIQFPIRSECNKLPSMHQVFWQIIFHHHEFGALKVVFDVFKPQNSIHFSHIEIAFSQRYPIWHIELLSYNLDHICFEITVCVFDGIHFSLGSRRYVNISTLACDQ